jgi:hypothetical protein
MLLAVLVAQVDIDAADLLETADARLDRFAHAFIETLVAVDGVVGINVDFHKIALQ